MLIDRTGATELSFLVPRDQPWTEEFRFWAGNIGGAQAAIVSASASLTPKAGGTVTQLTAVVTSNEVQTTATQTQLESLAAGPYVFEIQLTLTGGTIRQLRAQVVLQP